MVLALAVGACTDRAAESARQREQLERQRRDQEQSETTRLLHEQIERDQCLQWMRAVAPAAAGSPSDLLILASCADPNSGIRERLRNNRGTLVGSDPAPALPTEAELGPLVRVSIQPDLATMTVGQTRTYGLFATYQNGKSYQWKTEAVEWRSVGGTVSIDAQGTVTAIREGISIITGAVPTHPTEWRASHQIRVVPAG